MDPTDNANHCLRSPQMPHRTIRITEENSKLDVVAELHTDKAPTNADFLWWYLQEPRLVPAIHGMWTGPEISCPIPSTDLDEAVKAQGLPSENATLTPQPGDVVMSFVAPRVWGGNPDPIFDIGLFYGPGARMLFPIGWLAGSVVGHVLPEYREALTAACTLIRRNGLCEIVLSREAEDG
jgi:Protein of unknown function (DUF3830)